ncbi:cytosolic fe-s cluster assembly factor nbp35 [Quercus suber]|uniref:Cytosolic fe-s cluster assembly factor nbp35 n=1 Tax=Quercus suber TaxID=58331 RepID=A0AAW0LSW3_QUESU
MDERRGIKGKKRKKKKEKGCGDSGKSKSRKGNFMHQGLLSSIFASSEGNEDVILYTWLWKRDCPGTQSNSARKSDTCQGCPNQEACAIAPKGPDPELGELISIKAKIAMFGSPKLGELECCFNSINCIAVI